jgi:hypothetical protein
MRQVRLSFLFLTALTPFTLRAADTSKPAHQGRNPIVRV